MALRYSFQGSSLLTKSVDGAVGMTETFTRRVMEAGRGKSRAKA
jgi:hypothetical protein